VKQAACCTRCRDDMYIPSRHLYNFVLYCTYHIVVVAVVHMLTSAMLYASASTRFFRFGRLPPISCLALPTASLDLQIHNPPLPLPLTTRLLSQKPDVTLLGPSFTLPSCPPSTGAPRHARHASLLPPAPPPLLQCQRVSAPSPCKSHSLCSRTGGLTGCGLLIYSGRPPIPSFHSLLSRI
jgi:hypothetical protein